MKKLFYLLLVFDAYFLAALMGMVWWRTLHNGEPPFNVQDFYGTHATLGLLSIVGSIISGVESEKL